MPQPRVSVIIPAHNEARAIGLVLTEIPAGLAQEDIVVHSNSPDDTAAASWRAVHRSIEFGSMLRFRETSQAGTLASQCPAISSRVAHPASLRPAM